MDHLQLSDGSARCLLGDLDLVCLVAYCRLAPVADSLEDGFSDSLR